MKCLGVGALTMCVLAAWAQPAQAQERVTFASFDRAADAPVQLVAHWFSAGRKAPAVALFHGCNGAYDRQGRLDRRMLDYSAWLQARGFHVVVVDSFSARGVKEICTQRAGTQSVTQVNRRRDALATIDWLAHRDDVDATRIGLVGWSNGGSTVLAATNLQQPEVAAAALRPAFAVAFYPGCGADQRRAYEASTDLLLLLGEADDWTPAAACQRLAMAAMGIKPEVETYAGAYHGFDSSAPLRLRGDVPNGTHPGQGVHIGGNAEALARSRERLAEFIARH